MQAEASGMEESTDVHKKARQKEQHPSELTCAYPVMAFEGTKKKPAVIGGRSPCLYHPLLLCMYAARQLVGSLLRLGFAYKLHSRKIASAQIGLH